MAAAVNWKEKSNNKKKNEVRTKKKIIDRNQRWTTINESGRFRRDWRKSDRQFKKKKKRNSVTRKKKSSNGVGFESNPVKNQRK